MDEGDLVGDAERRLWDAFSQGKQVDMGPGDPTDEHFDPAQWAGDRTVRAEVITQLLLGGRDEERGRIAKVRLAGARITGAFDLNGGSTSYELHLERCWLDEQPDFCSASTKIVGFASCRLPGFLARGWQSAGPGQFAGSFFLGTMDLHGAKVGGQLNLSGATLTNPDGDALSAASLTVGQTTFFTNGFKAEGGTSLFYAQLASVSFAGAVLTPPAAEPEPDSYLTDTAYVTAIVLQGFGFVLAIAVLPALTRTLARADK